MSARADIAVGAWMAHADLARTLWDEGLLASDIARRVGHGATKNSIVGFAHRHGWPPRPSPIAVNGVRAVAAVPRQPYKPKKERKARKPKAPTPEGSTVPSQRPTVPSQPAPTPSSGCQWIEGPSRPWTMCGAPVASPGCAWCKEHRARVYVSRRPYMADAA